MAAAFVLSDEEHESEHYEEDEGYSSEYRRTPVLIGTEALEDSGLGEGWSPDGVDLSKLYNEVTFSGISLIQTSLATPSTRAVVV